MVCGERADAGPSYIRSQAHNLDTCRLPPLSATNKIRLHFLAQDVFLTAAAAQPPTLFTLWQNWMQIFGNYCKKLFPKIYTSYKRTLSQFICKRRNWGGIFRGVVLELLSRYCRANFTMWPIHMTRPRAGTLHSSALTWAQYEALSSLTCFIRSDDLFIFHVSVQRWILTVFAHSMPRDVRCLFTDKSSLLCHLLLHSATKWKSFMCTEAARSSLAWPEIKQNIWNVC